MIVGGRAGVKEVLLHHSLRNTIHAIYLAVHTSALLNLSFRALQRHRYSYLQEKVTWEVPTCCEVLVYRRCLFCNNGEAGIKVINKVNFSMMSHLEDTQFIDESHNFMGHRMRFAVIRYFPYSDYTPLTEEAGSLVLFRDCVDARLVMVLSSLLNVSMEIREVPERSWGTENNGIFNGMLGYFQQEEIDIGGPLGSTEERMKVVEFAGAYQADVISLVSLQPTPLPQHMSIIRPFTGSLWLALLVSMVALSVILWLLHGARRKVTGMRGVKLDTILLYSWGALINQSPNNRSLSKSGRVLLGIWLVFYLVITTCYTSSLIAHLTVRGKTKPPETLEDLVARDGWRWGIASWVMKGSPNQYFASRNDPVAKEIKKKLEIVTEDEALTMVKEGSYTLLSPKYYIKVVIESFFTDNYGQTLYYITNDGIHVVADFGWGFRQL
ncbi:ionotropic receptor 21a-like [Cherax quadricarinatus]